MLEAVHHINLTLPPGQEAAGRAFYCDLLGMVELEKPDSLKERGGFWLQMGEMQIHFSLDKADYRSQNRAHVAFLVSDLKRWGFRLREAGCPIHDAIDIPGFSRFYCRDPFGNRLEFMEKNRS